MYFPPHMQRARLSLNPHYKDVLVCLPKMTPSTNISALSFYRHSMAEKDGIMKIGQDDHADSEFTTHNIGSEFLNPISDGTSLGDLRDLLTKEFTRADYQQQLGEAFLPPRVVDAQNFTAQNSEEVVRNLHTDLESTKSHLVLVEGMPGTGKTTLVQTLVQDWSTRKTLYEYSLVLFLPLAKVKPAEKTRSIEDLASLWNVSDKLKSQFGEIVSTAAKRVLIILDGWDEFVIANRNQWKRSIIVSIVSRKVFSLATVIVTTRPSALKSLYQVVDNRVDLHLEVVGFSSHTVYQYFSSMKHNAIARTKILEFLDSYDAACELCRLPLCCSILWKLCTGSSGLPKSQTELASIMMLELVNRELCRSGAVKIGEISSLEPDLQERFATACRLAYARLTRGRHAQSVEDLTGFCSSFCLGESIRRVMDISVLGLVESSIVRRSDGSTYFTCKFINPIIEEYMAALAVYNLPLLNQLHALEANSLFFDQSHKHLIEFQFGQSTVNTSEVPTLSVSSLINLLVNVLNLEGENESSNADLKLFLFKCIWEAQDNSLWRQLASKHPQLLKVPLDERPFSHLEMMAISLMVANSGISRWEIQVTESRKDIAERLKSCIEERKPNVTVKIDKVGAHQVGMLSPSTAASPKATRLKKDNPPSLSSHLLRCKVIRDTIHRVLQLYSPVPIQSDCSEAAYVSFMGCGCLQSAVERSITIQPIPALHLVFLTHKARTRKMKRKASETEEAHYMEKHGGKSLEIILMSTPYPQTFNFVVQGTEEEVCIRLSGDFEQSCMEGEIATELKTSIKDEVNIVPCIQEQNQSWEKSEMVCHPLLLSHKEELEGAFVSNPPQEPVLGEKRADQMVVEHVMGSTALTASFYMHPSHRVPTDQQVVVQAETPKKQLTWRPGTIIFTSLPRVFSTDKNYSLPEQTHVIRKGGNGEIFVGNYGGITFAIKKTAYRAREFSIQTKLSHKNVVPLLAVMTGEQHTLHRQRYYCYYFMPKLTGDIARMVTDHKELTLIEIRKKFKDSPKELGLVVGNLKYLLEELLRGLSYLHSLHIVHRDIKGSNTLVKMYCSCLNPLVCSCTNKFSVLIADYDAAIKLDNDDHLPREKSIYHISPVGTAGFRAPEGSLHIVTSHLDAPEVSTSADIWSFGQLVLRMLIGVDGPVSQRQASRQYSKLG